VEGKTRKGTQRPSYGRDPLSTVYLKKRGTRKVFQKKTKKKVLNKKTYEKIFLIYKEGERKKTCR